MISRLEKLAEDGLIVKRGSSTSKTKHHYSLTDKAIDLFPVVLELVNWFNRHGSPSTTCGFLNIINSGNRDLMIADFKKKLRDERTESFKLMIE